MDRGIQDSRERSRGKCCLKRWKCSGIFDILTTNRIHKLILIHKRILAEIHESDYLTPMNFHDRITISPDKRSGQPCIRGMRITVKDILEYLAGGMTQEQILEDFPELEPEDFNACFAFAAHRESHLELAVAS